MIEKIGHIKNPLSVIAIFAAIAEISGTTVLPFIEASNQSVYIWFLMSFPILLVGAFFLTLNFNHRVLYAPSDYKDEKNFISSFSKARPDEQSKKLHDEVEEVEADEEITSSNTSQNIVKTSTEINPVSIVGRDRRREIMADVILAEKLAINKLSSILGVDFKTDIKFKLFPSSKAFEKSDIKMNVKIGVIFDAVHISDNSVHAVEVKLFRKKNIDYSRFSEVVRMSELVKSQCAEVSSKDFTLHVFAVMDAPEVEVESLKTTLKKSIASSKINIVPYVATLNDLQNEY